MKEFYMFLFVEYLNWSHLKVSPAASRFWSLISLANFHSLSACSKEKGNIVKMSEYLILLFHFSLEVLLTLRLMLKKGNFYKEY